jgi:protein-S-isoprenylcysteine O-methyltransferase Ste14
MKDWKRVLQGLPRYLLVCIWVALLLVQVTLAFFVFTEPRYPWLMAAGWAIWAVGTLFAIWPIFAFRTRGGAPKGKSYMQTTALVDTGLYAIVRHPQDGTAGILFNLALACIGQHWLLLALAIPAMVLLYADTFRADEECIQKFGQAYVRYMQRVPRVNFLAGIVRLLGYSEPQSTGL